MRDLDIATHSAKSFDSRQKQGAVRARIKSEIDRKYICSVNIDTEQTYFAMPYSASDIKVARDKIKSGAFNQEEAFSPVIARAKQIFLPLAQVDSYYVGTVMASGAVLKEVSNRVFRKKIYYKRWKVAASPMASNNHGDPVAMQAGKVNLIAAKTQIFAKSEWRGDFVEFSATVYDANLASGMVCAGFPSIAAVGGLIHSIERKLGYDLEFCLGVIQSEPKYSGTRGTNHQREDRAVTKSTKVAPFLDEIKGVIKIVLLVRPADRGDLEAIQKEMSRVNNFAGGSAFDCKITLVTNDCPQKASYLSDASNLIEEDLRAGTRDALDSALTFIHRAGFFNEENGYANREIPPIYSLNSAGYAFLNEAKPETEVRGDYLHVFVEPIFTLIQQGPMRECSWWKREKNNDKVLWVSAYDSLVNEEEVIGAWQRFEK
jgi:hypothetical protein